MPYCTSCGTKETEGQQFCPSCGKATSGNFAAPPLPYFPGEPPVEEVKTGLAGWWWRVLAFVIDSLLLAVVLDLPSRGLNLGFYATVAVIVVGTFAYGTFFIAYQNGQTVGMRITRIQVVNADGLGSVELGRSTRRAAVYGALLLIASVYHHAVYVNPTPQQTVEMRHAYLILLALSVPHYLDLLWPLWDGKNQTLHDKAVGTVVMRPPVR